MRLSAVAGTTSVNERETEVMSISESDTVDNLVILRFGNISAKLCFTMDLEAETVIDHIFLVLVFIQCSFPSFKEPYEDDGELKTKSGDTTPDISFIPETRPSSTNTSVDEESLIIPETQAVSFIRSSRDNEPSKIKWDEDLLIPETQDVLVKNPIIQHQNNDTACQFDESDLGTQFRICTQDFYEIDKDAIDDFDSSLLIYDGRQKTNKHCMQAEGCNSTIFGQNN